LSADPPSGRFVVEFKSRHHTSIDVTPQRDRQNQSSAEVE
jgi:hypothetical protein